jgi:O-antigen ligase
MNQPAQWIADDRDERFSESPPRHLSFLKFFLRYPIFLLALGPPIFRQHAALRGIDTSQAHFDFWSIFQVIWIGVPTVRAVIRLTLARSLRMPAQVRTILRLAFFLGLLYMISVVYSPGRVISAEFSLLYFATMICVTEFVVDVYRKPPNWVDCLFQLRRIAFFVLMIIVVTLFFAPTMVLTIELGEGIRLRGGAVGDADLLASAIALISAYNFLNSLESRVKSVSFFLFGLAGTLVTQSRGTLIALFVVLTLLGVQWAKTSGRTAYLFISGLIASILVSSVALVVIGGSTIWKHISRGQETADIASASGRTEIWTFAIDYCIKHPQGMGYVAGFRKYFTNTLNLHFGSNVANLGNCHNTFVQVLADAGWLALALYLMMNLKIVLLGWRYARKQIVMSLASENGAPHGIRCAMLLLLMFYVEGMESSLFGIPLQQPFYFQYVVIAIILGASARMIIASRARRPSLIR